MENVGRGAALERSCAAAFKSARKSASAKAATFAAMVGMARRAVPARVVAGGTNFRATLAFEGVAPLHAARTSQRDVPTTLNTYTGIAHPQHAASLARAGAASMPLDLPAGYG